MTGGSNTQLSYIAMVVGVVDGIVKFFVQHELDEAAMHGIVTTLSGFIVIELIKYVRSKINKKQNG
jgi:hypothetical protein